MILRLMNLLYGVMFTIYNFNNPSEHNPEENFDHCYRLLSNTTMIECWQPVLGEVLRQSSLCACVRVPYATGYLRADKVI